MKKQRQEGILILEDILSITEELLVLSKIAPNDKEKDIHREIKEGFQLKTKTELLVAAVSSLYDIILEIETDQESNRLWKKAEDKSPHIKQKTQNKQNLMAYLDTIQETKKEESRTESSPAASIIDSTD
ncbi:hypothetical protein NEMIN01_1780 [Nematocida minor]|uniref:uncharacterized protein n=1 Tax=Nematocida minor TaxID=1912983 RepID=UPI00221E76E0|nr:uncharacterized protein NEMIN01_1780 [Nematocida minor]KAI5191996.1 hypothetical protein NEMIN01_1780 [Nematocida minor]